MPNDITIRKETTPALTSLEALEVFADQAADFDTERLKYDHGRWSIGRDNTPVDIADRFLAIVPRLRHGHVRWDAGKPADRRMLLVTEHPVAPARAELGDLDQEEWPTGKDGQPADPWAPTHELPLIAIDTRTQLVFATSSVGGRQALNKLAGAYVKHVRKHPGQLPVIGLGSEPYRNKKYATNVENPTLLIFDWVAHPDWSQSKPEPSVRIAPNARARAEAADNSSPPVTAYEELDDKIPFEMPWK